MSYSMIPTKILNFGPELRAPVRADVGWPAIVHEPLLESADDAAAGCRPKQLDKAVVRVPVYKDHPVGATCVEKIRAHVLHGASGR